MKHAAIAVRPGSILGIGGKAYKVTGNSTMDRILTVKAMDPPHTTRTFHYAPGQEIHLRWKPDTRI
jgi:hypothetical protein